jgi:two-component system sensor histidine kinase AgrC
MYRRPSTVTPEIALIATASFIASSAQKPTLPASTKRLRSSGFQVRSTMQLSHYTALTSQYEANRRIRHDILHHVNTIRYLLANGQQQEATEYAGQLLAENQRSSQLGQCDNPVIDAFLYGRVQEAKAQGITVETHIILPVELPVSNTDLVIVFGNLMDNAVEACAKLENPKIELNAHIEKGYLVITESNPAVPEPEGRKQRRIPELERGVGMQILKSVAEKYQGSYMTETGNGNYSVSVFLKLGQAKEGNAIYAENSCV